MKIGFFELEGWEEDIIKSSFPGDELYFSKEKITLENLPEKKDFDVISTFIGSEITDEILGNFPDLKFVTTRSTGFDHIDLEACRKRGVLVGYVPGYGDNTVAEYAFGLLLNLTRKIYKAIDQIKETESFSQAGLQGIDLKNKIMGIVGTGRIGKEAVKIARGFGMVVYAYDPYPDYNFAQAFGVKYVPLEELLKSADAVSVHCPLTPETTHLINKKNIVLMKKGSFLINTSRGGVVETEAIVEALEKGILSGVGLDVLEEEGETKDEMEFLLKESTQPTDFKTMLENHVLMKHPNVLITPHNAFNTKEALERILGTTISNIKSYKAGQKVNLVE
ncbi:hydroxyacid dehydrogenase [Patescibacteria group bacterium]|nr:hydroxyacid dehydrogenase [Patescibacteria group bacterium]